MKIGDKVRFLSEVGGGKVAGFQGKNIVLVEDEDGFQVPMRLTEVVVVGDENYDTRHVVEAKATSVKAALAADDEEQDGQRLQLLSALYLSHCRRYSLAGSGRR